MPDALLQALVLTRRARSSSVRSGSTTPRSSAAARVRLRGADGARRLRRSRRSRPDPGRGEGRRDAAARAREPDPRSPAQLAPAGKGATILVKDEAANPSGSFKARRAALAVHEAQRLGYAGVIAATSGNYGAAVASQAAMRGLRLHRPAGGLRLGRTRAAGDRREGARLRGLRRRGLAAHGRPGALLRHAPLLEETGYFSASLYTPHAVAGIETLGRGDRARGARALRARAGRRGRHPRRGRERERDGARAAGRQGAPGRRSSAAASTCGASAWPRTRTSTASRSRRATPASASRSSSNPDRVDVPRNAARALRYLDRYVTVTQGEVFYVTEALAQLEGLERGPAGNTSLAAAFVIAQELDAGRDRRRPGDRVHGRREASDGAAHLRARARDRGPPRASAARTSRAG